MRTFLGVGGLGFGLAVGGGLVYALYSSESARLLSMFLLGAFLFGSTVLLTALFINRQWTKALGQSRTTHHHRYQLQSTFPPGWETSPSNGQRTQDLLPPLAENARLWDSVVMPEDIDDEVVA
jgi:hypothetical protein